MSNRYWVGGTGNWDASDTTHWAASSGGAGGETVPGTLDAAIFDASSGGGTVTVTETQYCNQIQAGEFTGTLNTNNQSIRVNGQFNVSGSGTRTLIYGSSTIRCAGYNSTVVTGLTLDSGTSTIEIDGGSTGLVFRGGGKTYYNLTVTGVGTGAFSEEISGSNTFTNLTITGIASKIHSVLFTNSTTQTITGTLTINGNSSTNRLLIASSVIGSTAIITAANVSITNADFQDITGAGAGSWNLSAITGGSGDCGGNSGITFTTSADQHWTNVNGGSWSTSTNWTSRVPLPQDDVYLDCAFGTSKTVTADMPRLGKSIDWTGATWTTALTLSVATTITFYGSVILISGLTWTYNGYAHNFSGRGSYLIKTYGVIFSTSCNILGIGGTLTLQDNWNIGGTLVISGGTLDANDYSLTVTTLNGGSGTLILGSATHIITGNSLNPWGMTVVPETSTIKFTMTSGTLTLNLNSTVWNNIWFSRGSSTGLIIISGSNTFNNFKDDGTEAHSILFTNSTTQTIASMTVNGSAGKLVSFRNTSGTTRATLAKSGGGRISGCDYIDAEYITGSPDFTWNLGANSIIGANTTYLYTNDVYAITATTQTYTLIGKTVGLEWPINLYWVGGTGNWSDITKWSRTSGGAGSAGIPTQYIDVFIDSNSGLSGGTINPDGSPECNNFTSNTGFNYTLEDYISVYGSLALESGVDAYGFDLMATTTGNTITTNGAIISEFLQFKGVGGGWTLQDNLTCIGEFYQENGTFDANNHNVTANDFYFYADTGYTPTVIMGSGTWEATNGDLELDTTNGISPTVNCETSTIKFTGSVGGGLYFYDDSKPNTISTEIYTFYNVWFPLKGNALNQRYIYGGIICNELKIGEEVGMVFAEGFTQVCNSFIATGSSGKIITLNIDTGTGQFTLSKSSGTVNCDYLDISNSNVTGGATWYPGSNSIDGGNNLGWMGWTQAYNLVCAVKNFTLSGIVTSLSRIRTLIAGAQSYALTGIDIIINVALHLFATTKTYALTFKDWILKGRGDWRWKIPTKNATIWTEKSKNSSNWTYQNKE